MGSGVASSRSPPETVGVHVSDVLFGADRLFFETGAIEANELRKPNPGCELTMFALETWLSLTTY